MQRRQRSFNPSVSPVLWCGAASVRRRSDLHAFDTPSAEPNAPSRGRQTRRTPNVNPNRLRARLDFRQVARWKLRVRAIELQDQIKRTDNFRPKYDEPPPPPPLMNDNKIWSTFAAAAAADRRAKQIGRRARRRLPKQICSTICPRGAQCAFRAYRMRAAAAAAAPRRR